LRLKRLYKNKMVHLFVTRTLLTLLICVLILSTTNIAEAAPVGTRPHTVQAAARQETYQVVIRIPVTERVRVREGRWVQRPSLSAGVPGIMVWIPPVYRNVTRITTRTETRTRPVRARN